MIGGNLALDFANTVGGVDGEIEAEFENLRGYGDLIAWGVRVEVISEEVAGRLLEDARRRPLVAEATYARALAIRDCLYEIFRAVARGERPPRNSLEALQRDECEILRRARLVEKGGKFVWEWPDDEDDPGRVLMPVVHAAVELLTSEELNRVKHCAHCRWLFVDRSKNRSRRWCTMEVCGTQAKMRRYVERRAEKREEKRQ